MFSDYQSEKLKWLKDVNANVKVWDSDVDILTLPPHDVEARQAIIAAYNQGLKRGYDHGAWDKQNEFRKVLGL